MRKQVEIVKWTSSVIYLNALVLLVLGMNWFSNRAWGDYTPYIGALFFACQLSFCRKLFVDHQTKEIQSFLSFFRWKFFKRTLYSKANFVILKENTGRSFSKLLDIWSTTFLVCVSTKSEDLEKEDLVVVSSYRQEFLFSFSRAERYARTLAKELRIPAIQFTRESSLGQNYITKEGEDLDNSFEDYRELLERKAIFTISTVIGVGIAVICKFLIWPSD